MTQPTTVTLTLPTTNTDGSSIATGELIDVDVGFGPASANGNGSFAYPTILEDALSALPAPANGVLSFPWSDLKAPLLPAGTTFLAARVKAANGPSTWSGEVQWVNSAVPSAPTGFSIA